MIFSSSHGQGAIDRTSSSSMIETARSESWNRLVSENRSAGHVMPAKSRRLPRATATQQLVALVERICTGGKYLDCITEVHVFGSYARGASMVGDIDVSVTYDARLDEAVDAEVLDRLLSSRDWNTPFRKALRPSRAIQLMFNRLEMIAEPVLVYQRGDQLEECLARISSIAEDRSAGRATRDPVHPALEPVIDDLARPSRILLTELASRGYVSLELIDLPDAELDAINNDNFRSAVADSWSDESPLARAARAAGRWLEQAGADLDRVHLLGRDLDDSETPWAIEARESKLDLLVPLMGRWGVRQWLFVIRPNRKRPLVALVAKPLNQHALESIRDVHIWLGEHAPHVGRVG